MVEIACAEHAPLHRAQHLHVFDGSSPNRRGMRSRTISIDLRDALLRLGDLDHVEVAVLARLGRLRHLAAVDPVGIDDDPALGGLAEHLGQSRDRQAPRGDDVSQHLPRPDGGQLIHVAHEQQPRMLRNGLVSAFMSGTSTMRSRP